MEKIILKVIQHFTFIILLMRAQDQDLLTDLQEY